MALNYNYLGFEGDNCRCGRRASIKHCPFCGSFQVTALKTMRQRVNPDSGLIEEIRYFSCRCGMKFDETAFFNCQAPEYLTKVLRTARDIERTAKAVEDNHPLTKKEEIIADNLLLPQLTAEQERSVRLEWARARLGGMVSISVDEYILLRRKELANVGFK